MKIIFIDESGVVNDQKNRYFIIGGLIFDDHYIKTFEETLYPFISHIISSYHLEELKSNILKSTSKRIAIASVLGAIKIFPGIKTFISVFDLKEIHKIKEYDKKSFMYNKTLEWTIKDLIHKKLIDKDDRVRLVLDELSLSEWERNNMKYYLRKRFNIIRKIDMKTSKSYILLQIADLLAGIINLKNPTASVQNQDLLKITTIDMIEFYPKKIKNENQCI